MGTILGPKYVPYTYYMRTGSGIAGSHYIPIVPLLQGGGPPTCNLL